MSGAEYCFVHNPATREAHKAAVIRGGASHASRSPLDVPDLRRTESIPKTLALISAAVLAGKLSPAQAKAATYALSQALAAKKTLTEDWRMSLSGERQYLDPLDYYRTEAYERVTGFDRFKAEATAAEWQEFQHWRFDTMRERGELAEMIPEALAYGAWRDPRSQPPGDPEPGD